MDCNKDEAMKAKELAESKFQAQDIAGAKKFALKAKTLYPALDGINQMIAVLDVYLASEVKINGEMDWYKILSVDGAASEEAMKKQYKRLALQLHPDKNKNSGAEAAFKLVSEAWSVLSDKEKKKAYDQRRYASIVPPQPRPQQPKGDPFDPIFQSTQSFGKFANRGHRVGVRRSAAASAHVPIGRSASSGSSETGTFGTMCPRCLFQHEYQRKSLHTFVRCSRCLEEFFAGEIIQPQRPAPAAYYNPWSQNVQGFGANNSSGPSMGAPAFGQAARGVDSTSRENMTQGSAGGSASSAPAFGQTRGVDSSRRGNMMQGSAGGSASSVPSMGAPVFGQADRRVDSTRRGNMMQGSAGGSASSVPSMAAPVFGQTRGVDSSKRENMMQGSAGGSASSVPSKATPGFQQVRFVDPNSRQQHMMQGSRGSASSAPEVVDLTSEENTESTPAAPETSAAQTAVKVSRTHGERRASVKTEGTAKRRNLASRMKKPGRSGDDANAGTHRKEEILVTKRINISDDDGGEKVEEKLARDSQNDPPVFTSSHVRKMLMAKARLAIRKKLEDWKTTSVKSSVADEKPNKTPKLEESGMERATDAASGTAIDQKKRPLKSDGNVVDSKKPKLTAHVKANDAAGQKEKTLKANAADQKEHPPVSMIVPDSDFHDFDKDRSETSLRKDEIWAAYNDEDGMPRYYVLVQKVISSKPFKVLISYLNSKSNAEFGPVNWVASGFTKTSGEFRIGKYVTNNNITIFSHRVKWQRAARGIIKIFPKKGDVWALFRNWSPDWNEFTPDEVMYKYEMVQVLEDYNEKAGVQALPLVKVPGFKAVFRQHPDQGKIKTIPRGEIFRLSHQVPCLVLTGEEADNAPKGCLELDPAATPLELLQVITEETAMQ